MIVCESEEEYRFFYEYVPEFRNIITFYFAYRNSVQKC